MSFYSKIVDPLNAAARTKDAAKVAPASRDAVRSTVKFLFEKKGVEWDEKATLLALIHSRTVEEFVAVPEQIAALDFVRMLGSNAEHGAHVKKPQAVRAEKTARDFAALVGAAFEPGSVTAPDVRQDLSEAETRKLYIDAYLEEAGWKVSTVKGELVPGGASIEYKATVASTNAAQSPDKTRRVCAFGRKTLRSAENMAHIISNRYGEIWYNSCVFFVRDVSCP